MPHIVLRSRSGHILPVLWSLHDAGWRAVSLPKGGKVPRNGLLLTLKTDHALHRFRVLVYKVTVSSRRRTSERRVEITSTYKGRLKRQAGFEDVVLGYDRDRDIFVGLDPIRLEHGGKTANASSFIDLDGLSWKRPDEILVRSRPTTLRANQVEYQAYIKPPCLSDYLLNTGPIHADAFEGPYQFIRPSKRRNPYHPLDLEAEEAATLSMVFRAPRARIARPRVTDADAERYESSGRRRPPRPITPKELEELNKRLAEIGELGERYVLDQERRRLTRAKRPDLAARVRWVARKSVSDGYDIASFEATGEQRYIEVKATTGTGMVFFASTLEWTTARRLNTAYYIYRVITVRRAPSIAARLQDPVHKAQLGVLRLSPSGYRVKIT